MEPTEIAGLVEHREALVHGVKEGVIAIDQQQRVTVVNDSRPPAARRCRWTASAAGSTSSSSTRSWSRRSPAASPSPTGWCWSATGCSPSTAGRCAPHGQVIGSVTTLRDRTELSALERELGTSRATSDTLRAQTHEFANQLHTISGLLQLEEYDEVVRFVDGVRLSRTSLYDEVTSRIDDATVAALLIAKASLATERGVDLRLDPTPASARCTARCRATSHGRRQPRRQRARRHRRLRQPRVDVRLVAARGRDDGHRRGQRPGCGIPRRCSAQGYTTKANGVGAVGGRGFGLALTRLVCRRRGGT